MPTHSLASVEIRLLVGYWLGVGGATLSGLAHFGTALKAVLLVEGSLQGLQVMTIVGFLLAGGAIAMVLPLLNKIDREQELDIPVQKLLWRSMGTTHRLIFWSALIYVNVLGIGMIIGLVPTFMTLLLSAFGLAAGTAGALYCRQLIHLRNV